VFGGRPLGGCEEVMVEGSVGPREGMRCGEVELLTVIGVAGCGFIVELYETKLAVFDVVLM